MSRPYLRWWSIAGAIYVVHAIKRVQGMRLIGPAWKDKKRLAAALQPSAHRRREPALETERSVVVESHDGT